MRHGKKYRSSAEAIAGRTKETLGLRRPSRSSRARPRPSSTRRWRSRPTSASTRGTPTSWSAAPSCCRTAPASRSACWSSPRARRRRRPQAAGADFVGADEYAKKIKDGWTRLRRDHRHAGHDGRARPSSARILGPRGLMPNPKSGTVTFDVAKAVKELKAGKIEFRVDKGGNVHAPIGKASFTEEQLFENALGLPARARAREAGGGQGCVPQVRHAELDHGSRGRRSIPRSSSTRSRPDGEEPSMPTAEKEQLVQDDDRASAAVRRPCTSPTSRA